MLSTRIAAITIAMTAFISGNSNAPATEAPRYKMNRHQERSFYGGDGLPTYLRGIGTYVGGISGVRAPYNGIYFARDGGRYSDAPSANNAPRSRIIHVNQRTVGAECSYEAGVCIIRGR